VANFLVADLYIVPGGAVMGEHYHPAIEERFTLIRGELGVRLSGRAIKTTPGAMLLVPPGVPHDWWNAGGKMRSFALKFARLRDLN
jgi:quercetin dioxygenase-like cupin family protein